MTPAATVIFHPRRSTYRQPGDGQVEETFPGENHSQIIKTIIVIIATVIIIIIIITVAINIMTKIAAIGEPIIPINHANPIKIITIDD